jgi:hypothetical protein
MKQNITLAVETRLLKRARVFAARRGTSISAMLAGELHRIVEQEETYEQSKRRALEHLRAPFHLGGKRSRDRGTLHDRKSLR